MSGSTLSTLLRGLRIAAVPHGFRSSFRDWCGECSNAPREVAEAALAHVVATRWKQPMRDSDLFERRRGPDGRLGEIPSPWIKSDLRCIKLEVQEHPIQRGASGR